MYTYTIGIGSNYNREENLRLARKQLTALFPSIRFANEEETKPFLLHNPALFTNQVAQFQSNSDIEEIKIQLKTIEKMAGRQPKDKALEKVVLDIDLLLCNDTVLKPKDMEYPHIIRGIRQLK